MRQTAEKIRMTELQLDKLILRCRRKWNSAWSKEYREMDEERLLQNVKEYMKNWMMLETDGSHVWILPAAGKTSGFYPNDFKIQKGTEEEDA